MTTGRINQVTIIHRESGCRGFLRRPARFQGTEGLPALAGARRALLFPTLGHSERLAAPAHWGVLPSYAAIRSLRSVASPRLPGFVKLS